MPEIDAGELKHAKSPPCPTPIAGSSSKGPATTLHSLDSDHFLRRRPSAWLYDSGGFASVQGPTRRDELIGLGIA
jgi:hypothetical protein